MTPTKIVFNRLICQCQRCPNVWVAETMERPKRCGACKSVLWDREPQPRGPKPRKKKRGDAQGEGRK
jgi:hypothetical protein